MNKWIDDITPEEWDKINQLAIQNQSMAPPENNNTYEPVADPNVSSVIYKMKKRAHEGMMKYGVTTEDNPLELKQWLQHAQEEMMDCAIYLERIMQEIEK